MFLWKSVSVRNYPTRPDYKQVPEEVIEKMYARFATQYIPTGIVKLCPDELDRIWYKPMDFSEL